MTYSTKQDENSKEILPNEKDLKINIKDETAAIKGRTASLNIVEGVARIFAEWKFTKKAIENLNEEDIVVRDGSLQTGVKNEGNYAKEVYCSAINKKIFLLGLSKTCTLLTENGYSLISALNYFAEKYNFKKEWYYENLEIPKIKEQNPISLNFAKLNKNSRYIFRVENLKQDNENKALIFPGYPYGLIDADKNARVRKKEIESLRTLILSEVAKNKNFKEIEILINSVNAHELLNEIVGE